MPYKLTFEDGSDGYLAQAELDPEEVERRRYAFPDERKFPLTDASKVMSAIKFFNYVEPKNERHLANAILKRMEELGISEVNVGPTNRFKKYYEASNGYLKHFGVKGMHWGVWNEETRARRMGTQTSSNSKKLTEKQKRNLKIGLVAVGVGLSVVGGYALVKNAKTKKIVRDAVMQRGKEAAKKAFEKEATSWSKIDPSHTIDKDAFIQSYISDRSSRYAADVDRYLKNIKNTKRSNRKIKVSNFKKKFDRYSRMFPDAKLNVSDFTRDFNINV